MRIITDITKYTNENGKNTVMSELKKCGEYFRQAIDVYISK